MKRSYKRSCPGFTGQAILTELREGPQNCQDLADRLGRTQSATHASLRTLLASGHVVKLAEPGKHLGVKWALPE